MPERLVTTINLSISQRYSPMQLTSGRPFWPAYHGFIHTYEPMTHSATCDVAIIGGGITGSLLAKKVVDAGYETVLVDCRNCGWGSTAATTALIQYEIDTHLVDLIKCRGREPAVTAYSACRSEIDKIQAICDSVSAGDFQSTQSFYLASRRSDVKRLREEYEARLQLGLEVAWLNEAELKQLFDFPVEGAIVSRVAGIIDAYELTHALLHQAAADGLKVFARTQVESISESESGVELATNRGPVLKARWAVVAAGYESLNYLKSKPKVTMHNTFAFATESIPEFAGWPPNSILWESARPYFYARTTRDHRAMFGGADISFRSAEIRERLAARQTTKLERRWRELFPRIPLEIAVTWAGTFAETPDGLPYVGFPASQPRTFFALCYGGNGIIYSAIAGDMLMAALQGERHPCTEIFGFERK